MEKTYKYIMVISALLIITGTSCKKFIEIDPPSDRIITSTLFKDDVTATAAVIGLYARMTESTPTFAMGAVTIYTSVSSDEMTYSGLETEASQFSNNKIAINNSINAGNLWRNAYEIIYQSNLIIQGLESANGLTPAIKKQLTGETLFIRAFSYWYLINLFGDVPLVTGVNYDENSKIPRIAKSIVQDKVIKDLEQAKSFLLAAYPSASKLRVNQFSATALLARVRLYKGDFQQAESLATEVIGSGVYAIENDPASSFLAGSKEALWQMIPDQNFFDAPEGYYFTPSEDPAERPAYQLTTSMVAAFETGDRRRQAWVGEKTVDGTKYFYPAKYKVRFDFGQLKTEILVMLRLSELYLIRAEARFKQQNKFGATEDLNYLRAKRRAFPTANVPTPLPDIASTSTDAQVEVVLFNERQVELFAEWGNRWFDLRRSGKIDEIMSAVKPGWNQTSALFPIPANEILANKNLVQNPGYIK